MTAPPLESEADGVSRVRNGASRRLARHLPVDSDQAFGDHSPMACPIGRAASATAILSLVTGASAHAQEDVRARQVYEI